MQDKAMTTILARTPDAVFQFWLGPMRSVGASPPPGICNCTKQVRDAIVARKLYRLELRAGHHRPNGQTQGLSTPAERAARLTAGRRFRRSTEAEADQSGGQPVEQPAFGRVRWVAAVVAAAGPFAVQKRRESPAADRFPGESWGQRVQGHGSRERAVRHITAGHRHELGSARSGKTGRKPSTVDPKLSHRANTERLPSV